MSETHWKEIVKQARKCDPGDKLYSYSMREKNTVVVLFFNSIYHLVGVKFGDHYTTLDNLDASQQDLVESWKNLAYRNINGMQRDHRMINGHPMPLLVSDVTSLPGSSTLPPHNSNSQIRNSAFGTQPYSPGIETPEQFLTTVKDVSFERDDSLVSTFPMETAPTEDTSYPQSMECLLANGVTSYEQATPVCPQNQVESSPFLESLRAQSNFPQMSSFDLSFFEGPIQTSINNLPASLGGETNHSLLRMSSFELSFFEGPIQTSINNLPASLGGETNHSLSRMSSFELSFFEGPTQTSINNLPASLGGETSHSLSRMSSFELSFFEGPIQTSINNLPAPLGGETSRSVAPPSLPPRWSKLLAPIKWVQFAKKRRARILVC